MPKKGFTLIELLVVISIVSLLSSIALASLNTARDKARLAAARQFSATAFHVAGDQAVGIWDLDEGGTGVVAKDNSGNGNDGTLSGMTLPGAWSTDTYSGRGYSLLFDGVNDLIDVPYSASLAPSSAVSFGAWFKSNSLSGGQRILSKTETGGYQLSINENGVCPVNTLCAMVFVGSTYHTVSFPVSGLSTGKWYFAMATYDGDTLKLYLDGKEIASNTNPNGNITYSSNNSFCIGAEPAVTCGGANFSGYIDEVRVYAKALTAKEQSRLFAEGSIRHSLASI